ncbi:hypothetical protein RUND412_010667 [Rhizina undulata]
MADIQDTTPGYLSYRGVDAWSDSREPNSDFRGEPGKHWRAPFDGGNEEHDPPRADDVIDLSVAENTLMFEELKKQIKEDFPKILVDQDFTYGEGPGGTSRLRNHLSDFINTHFNVPVSAKLTKENIITTPGVYAALEQISWAVGNPGDGILVGRPLYGGFIKGFTFSRSRVKTVPVTFGDVDPFSKEAVQIYRNAFDTSNDLGTPIKAILLCNPHNPLGRCFKQEVLEEYIDLCLEKKIHLISDEIYAMSHYKNPHATEDVTFTSLLSVPKASATEDAKKLVHVLYGMSKDFGSSGVRLGAIISRGTQILNAIITNSFLSWVSSGGDIMWSAILSSNTFLTDFFKINQARLAAHYKIVTDDLAKNGINWEKEGNSGLFVWVDLSYALEPNPGHKTNQEREDYITNKLLEKKIRLSAGRKFKTEKLGWYRLTFSRPQEYLTQAVVRIVDALGQGPNV